MANPVYLVAQIDVKDYESYILEYGFPLLDQLTEVGAEVLAGSGNIDVLEGDWPGNWVAIIKFPDEESMAEFYNSDKYAPLKALRIDKLSNSGAVVVVPGLGEGE